MILILMTSRGLKRTEEMVAADWEQRACFQEEDEDDEDDDEDIFLRIAKNKCTG